VKDPIGGPILDSVSSASAHHGEDGTLLPVHVGWGGRLSLATPWDNPIIIGLIGRTSAAAAASQNLPRPATAVAAPAVLALPCRLAPAT
jgi:hypothetical protein